jgi:hypothetical protein
MPTELDRDRPRETLAPMPRTELRDERSSPLPLFAVLAVLVIGFIAALLFISFGHHGDTAASNSAPAVTTGQSSAPANPQPPPGKAAPASK